MRVRARADLLRPLLCLPAGDAAAEEDLPELEENADEGSRMEEVRSKQGAWAAREAAGRVAGGEALPVGRPCWLPPNRLPRCPSINPPRLPAFVALTPTPPSPPYTRSTKRARQVAPVPTAATVGGQLVAAARRRPAGQPRRCRNVR